MRHKWKKIELTAQSEVMGIVYDEKKIEGKECERCGMIIKAWVVEGGFDSVSWIRKGQKLWTNSRKYPECKGV